MPLMDGERQVTTELDQIRQDHVERYRWAAAQLNKDDVVLDCGCGVGYGSNMLAGSVKNVYAFDQDAETVDYARRHWQGAGVVYHHHKAEELPAMAWAEGENPVAVAFEVIEHIVEPKRFLRSLRASGVKTLFASVPNEAVYPLRTPERSVKFHVRHYTREDFENLLNESGWRVDEWWGQAGTESPVEREAEGRTLVVKCSPVAQTVSFAQAPTLKHDASRLVLPQGDKPLKHVSIVALGGSAESYMASVKRLGSRHAYCDETWAINAMGSVIACDLVIHMDDVRVQEIRAAARPDSNIAHMVKWLKTSPVPVMTSVPHPDYPATIAFPFEDVVNDLGSVYFNNTVAYAVAYAIHRKVEKISLFGCDFGYANQNKAERGRACVEYWLGVADARGIKIGLPVNTCLCDTLIPDRPDDVYAYGYDGVRICYEQDADGRHRFTFTPRESLPTADEIEAAYDHGKPPDAQVLRRRAAE